MTFGIAINIFGETEASMGIALGDVNGDQQPDVFVTHLDEETNTLYLSTGSNALIVTFSVLVTSGLPVHSHPEVSLNGAG